jgi:SpoVK/Ycf46/Vps4 family AAA+-type ATPase
MDWGCFLMLSPSELHTIYNNNVNTFYTAAGGTYLAAEADAFLRGCVIGLWSKSAAVDEKNVALINELYSKGQPKPKYLYWELTGEICAYSMFRVPEFFTGLVGTDRLRKTDSSRILARIMTNILLAAAAADDDVSVAEADYITTCTGALISVCDSSGVKQSKAPLNAADYITSTERSFLADINTAKQELPKTEVQSISAPKKGETEPSLDELMAKLDALIGLEKIKTEVKSLVNLIKIRRLRTEHKLAVPPISLHMVFMGNPGTGKTTVARLLSGIFRALGALSKGQLVEADRSGLVAGYIGQTAIKTAEAVEKAKGGILFVDEDYSLTPGEGSTNDYGHEAIEIILKAMEDNREDFVVIVAGYENLMEKFISSNPGLESRFSKYFVFEDYNEEQLHAIFLSMCEKNEYMLSDKASAAAKAMFKQLYDTRDDNFGNARDVRNIFERAVQRQSDRVAALEAPTREDLMTILPEDLPEL